ncbi:hypothetical protein [Nitratireductor sp. GZWM139]|uniref:hypothetical protein n=1 Tax=Nitratireductor sp. GZWM139 TaxID=2950541 RepID=UPI0024BEB636|nr:hypothetical protein [Nitratireductor sp. GZWM139]MDJ1462707.1 hypothetical protein [Nitratireductor sp. GZWM139]
MKIFRAEPLRHYRFDDVRLGFFDRLFVTVEEDRPDLNRQMFKEDFADIFNYANRSSGKFFDISSNDEDLTERLLSNVHTRYGPHPVDKTVREWVEVIAQSLVWFGAAYYSLTDDTERDDIHIASFGSSGVVHLFGTHIQWVPKRTVRHWDRDDELVSREIRILDSAKVMCFVIPKAMKRMLSLQNRTLAAIDKHQFRVTDFHPQPTHENPNPTNHFDFSFWRDTQERAQYRSTRATGWNGRKYDSSKRSDFFDCHRLIRFRRNQLVLRDNILSQLSSELSRVGKGYNSEFIVEISGTDKLPSVAYLNELEARLIREEASFSEIIDYCLKC